MYAADRACVNTMAQALDLCDRRPGRTASSAVAVDVLSRAGGTRTSHAQIARATSSARSRLLAFHICDWLVPTRDLLLDRGMMGDGVIDLRLIRSWVESGGYRGLHEVEIFSAADWWQRDPDEVLDIMQQRHERCC